MTQCQAVKISVNGRVFVIETGEGQDIELDLGTVKVSMFDIRDGAGPDL